MITPLNSIYAYLMKLKKWRKHQNQYYALFLLYMYICNQENNNINSNLQIFQYYTFYWLLRASIYRCGGGGGGGEGRWCRGGDSLHTELTNI